ncbi:MAG: N-acetylmuramoyl-L-alanine amidase [Eubacteriales bacterium]
MNESVRKQLRTNAIFTLFFALTFFAYCVIASALFEKSISTQSNDIVTLRRKTIVVDPGHGGEDCGAIGINGVLEKDINLLISENLCELLKFAGYEVIPTRTEDILLYDRNVDYEGRKKVLDLAARRKIAEDADPDIFVGIHMNSFPQARYSGLTVYYSKNNTLSFRAADALRKDVVAQLQPTNERELKAAGSNIFLLDRLSCPAVLIECGFLSNENECELLCTDTYKQKLSYVFYSSLATFLEE